MDSIYDFPEIAANEIYDVPSRNRHLDNNKTNLEDYYKRLSFKPNKRINFTKLFKNRKSIAVISFILLLAVVIFLIIYFFGKV